MSMLELLGNFKTLIKVPSLIDKAIIDNTFFRIHYRTTTLIFFVCCAFVTAYTIFGDPIKCVGEFKDDDRIKVVNTYCYLGYTYTLPANSNGDGKAAGIGPQNGPKKYHYYYRWIPLMLFLQGALFYIPHWIWKSWENKKIAHLTKGLRGPVVQVKTEHKDGLKTLSKYAADSLHTHNMFALMFYFCEFLNFINVVLNIYMIDYFLGGEFLTYGLRVLEFTDIPQENRTDPMIETFPRITKCDFNKGGPSGTIQSLDFMCVLALNNLNEKIYIFLWFWLLLVACISIVPIAYNVAVFVSPSFRKKELEKHYILGEKAEIGVLARRSEIGDFFVWDLIARNISSKCYREFIDGLYSLIEKRPDTPRKLSFSYISADETKF